MLFIDANQFVVAGLCVKSLQNIGLFKFNTVALSTSKVLNIKLLGVVTSIAFGVIPEKTNVPLKTTWLCCVTVKNVVPTPPLCNITPSFTVNKFGVSIVTLNCRLPAPDQVPLPFQPLK